MKMLSTQEHEELLRDAKRYRFLREEDNWGDDSEQPDWDTLGEATTLAFDAYVDQRMKNKEK